LSDATTRLCPSGEKARVDTPPSPVRVRCRLPSETRHRRTAPSEDPTARLPPSGEKAALVTVQFSFPCRVWTGSPMGMAAGASGPVTVNSMVPLAAISRSFS
jgi:hypothetical protein